MYRTKNQALALKMCVQVNQSKSVKRAKKKNNIENVLRDE
jgi:hypothetical protein